MSLKAEKIGKSRLAVALLGSTVLAGLPVVASAQDEAATVGTQDGVEAASAGEAAAQAESNTIRTLTVSGFQRLEPATILSYIQLREGQPYSQAAADQALKDLYATELFANVQIRNESGNVVIEVQENPVINRIVLEGNKTLK
ncbi:MAG: POTRA domain-containing protein, partial [Novosphingobium sp.]